MAARSIAAALLRVLLVVLIAGQAGLSGASAHPARPHDGAVVAAAGGMDCCADPARTPSTCAQACSILPLAVLPAASADGGALAPPVFVRDAALLQTRSTEFEPPPPKSASA